MLEAASRPGLLLAVCAVCWWPWCCAAVPPAASSCPAPGRCAAVPPAASPCPAPGRCRCLGEEEEHGGLLRVDCSDLELRSVPANTSLFTSYLDLSMNNITSVPPGAFSTIHFLEELRLAGNDLSFIARGAFSGLYNLRVLMLQNNQLTYLPVGLFQNLPNLQSLRLDANRISSVPIGCFSGLPALRHLWLDDNSLEEVPVGALSELGSLQAMTLALNHISHVPDHAFRGLANLVVLHLNNNKISSMGNSCFHGLQSLETLDLNFNSLVDFPVSIQSLRNLKELGFHSNSIRSIPEHAFTGNPALLSIFFYDNPIQSVGRSAFQNLPELQTLSLNGAAELTEFPNLTGTYHLESLTITGSRISSLPPLLCEKLPNLQLLDVSYNRLQSLPSLSACKRLQKIDLHHNDIQQISDYTFHGLLSLHTLDISWNRLSSTDVSGFAALPSLNKLDLSFNQLSSLPVIGLGSLTHLRLAGNRQLTQLIQRESLPRVRVMEVPYAFQCCAFISCLKEVERTEEQNNDEDLQHEPTIHTHTVHCTPTPGPLHSCLHLFSGWLLRGGVWLIAVISLAGNALVALSVFVPATPPPPPPPRPRTTPPARLLIGLLALVNGMMGVWTAWTAAVDAWTYGRFWRYGVRWENSFLCGLSSFLSVFSSESALFLLTLAALERSRARSTHTQKVGLCFLLSVVVSVPPLLVGDGTAASLCLPLFSLSSCLSSSMSLLLLNSLCFLVMTLAYLHAAYHHHHHHRSGRGGACGADGSRPRGEEEEEVLRRHVAFLIFSNLLLFLPVVLLSLSSVLHLKLEAVQGALLLVVALPAAINPLLYLLFTPLAREHLQRALWSRRKRSSNTTRPAVAAPAVLGWLYRSRGGAVGGGGGEEEEEEEKRSCDSTQALVEVGGVTEEEEEEEEVERGRWEVRQHPPAVLVELVVA